MSIADGRKVAAQRKFRLNYLSKKEIGFCRWSEGIGMEMQDVIEMGLGLRLWRRQLVSGGGTFQE